jgi:uncharacterized coiled-coil protein SlyX
MEMLQQELIKRIGEIEKRLAEIGKEISAESETLKKKQIEQEKLNQELRILLGAKKELDEM